MRMVDLGTSKYDCSRAYMLIANFLLFILGMGMAGYGIYQVVSMNPDSVLASVTGWTMQTGINAIMSGSIAIVASLLGFVGLVLHHKLLIFLYTVSLTVAILMDIAALIMLSAASKAASMTFDEIKGVVSSEYGSGSSNYSIALTESVDEYQKAESCCGWSGSGGDNIFIISPWYLAANNFSTPGNAVTYPESCCAPVAPGTNRNFCVRATDDSKARKMGYIYVYDCLDKLVSHGPMMYLRLSEYIFLLLLQTSSLFFAIQLMIRLFSRENSPTGGKHQQQQQQQQQQQKQQQQQQQQQQQPQQQQQQQPQQKQQKPQQQQKQRPDFRRKRGYR